jgi:RNA polymerase sigma-70 factor (ECF subfamily)
VAVSVSTADSQQADEELFRRYGPLVLRLCRFLLRDAHEAEDAAQQVFLRAYRALHAGVRPRRTRSWLAEIARNECRARARVNATRRETELTDGIRGHELDATQAAALDALMASLREELAELPPRQREALLLREVRGLSYAELAAVMGVTEAAVESLLQRARRRLAERLEAGRRSLVGATLAVESLRSLAVRLLSSPSTADVGTSAAVAKVAATGAVVAAVGVLASDSQQRPQVPPATESAAVEQSQLSSRHSSPQPAAVPKTRRDQPERSGTGHRGSGGGGPDEGSGHGHGTSRSSSSGRSDGAGGSGSSGPGPGESQASVSGGLSGPGNSGSGSLSSGSGSVSSGSGSGSGSGSVSSGSGSGSGSGWSGSSESGD